MPVLTPKSSIDLEKSILTKSIKKSFLIDLLTTNNAIYDDSLTSIIRSIATSSIFAEYNEKRYRI